MRVVRDVVIERKVPIVCYPRPGPRCSSHARANYVEAKALLDSLNESGEPIDTPTYQRANAKFSRAKVDYLETPEGIKILSKGGRDIEAEINEKIRASSIASLKKAQPNAKEDEAHQGVEGFKDYVKAPESVRQRVKVPSPDASAKRKGNNPFSPAAMSHQKAWVPVQRVNAVRHLANLDPKMIQSQASYGASRNNRNATMTDNQVKKHYTHMNSEELAALGKSLNILGDPKANIKFHAHASRREDFQATQAEVQELLSRPDIQDRIIEYNVNKKDDRGMVRMERRVLIRDDKAVDRDYVVGGKYNKEWRSGPSNACYSISLDTNQVVTVYYNDANDNHRSIDQSRYNPTLKVI